MRSIVGVLAPAGVRSGLHSSRPPGIRTTRERGLAKLAAIITLVYAFLAHSGLARAQTLADQPPMLDESSAETPADEPPRLDERTAHMIGGQRLKIGLLAIEYGLTDRISVGVDPPAWAARAVISVWVPNVHAKVALLKSDPFVLSIKGGGYFADLKREESAPGNLVAVPVSLFASARLAPHWWLHGEGMYLYAHASGTGDLDNVDLNGAVAARAAQLGAMLEYRMTRVVSLTALGRYQAYAGRLILDGSGTVDPYTTVQVDAELEPRLPHPWLAVAGVAFMWRHVRLVVGGGYGNYFIPGLSIAMPDRAFVPDFSLSVVL